MNQEMIENAIRLLLTGLGEDLEREGVVETPKRAAKMYLEMLEGMNYTNEEIAKMFGKSFEVDTTQMVIVKDIEAFSMCEHHLVPFFGKAHIAYIPKGKVAGLSKLARTVEVYAKKPQLQEKQK